MSCFFRFPHRSYNQGTHNNKACATAINDINSAGIVEADAAYAITHNRAILFVQLDKLPAKLAPALIPRSPVVAEPCQTRARDVAELAPVAVQSPAAQSQDSQAESRSSTGDHTFTLLVFRSGMLKKKGN